MKRILISFCILLATSLCQAKVITDKSKQFQFEVPDTFTQIKAAGTVFASPDQKVSISSMLMPASASKRDLTSIAKDYSAAQEKRGNIPQRAGSIVLGGSPGMAIEFLDAKKNTEISFLVKSKQGIAVLVLEFRAPISANPTMFSQLVARSFRWLIK
jgi:hypothetical protein